MFDFRAEPVEFYRAAILGEEYHMRVANIERGGGFEQIPGDRHLVRVDRIGERHLIPFKARLAHVHCDVAAARVNRQQPAQRFNPQRRADQQPDRAGGIAAGFDLAAVLIEDPHLEVGRAGWLQQDQLVAANSGAPVSQCRSERSGHHRHAISTRVEHDEIVAQSMHFDEGNLHPRRFKRCARRRPVLAG